MKALLKGVAILAFASASGNVFAKAEVTSGPQISICTKTSSALTRDPSQPGEQLRRFAQDRKPASCCNATVKTCC